MAPRPVSFGKGLVLSLTGFSVALIASAEASSSATGAVAVLPDVGEIRDFAGAFLARPLAARVATPLAAFALGVAFFAVFLVDFFAGFLTGFLADFVVASFFLACFFLTDFLADFFAACFAFFAVFFAIIACSYGGGSPPNANPGSSQRAFDVRSGRSGRSFRRSSGRSALHDRSRC